ncbi:D-dopachrome decarboxylase-like [Haliotis asinina]|uniref:D-dopachrome decarboxylase-like n=1 Tax=Haliotis asinina TaxID=109174 RepID=UPI0035318B4F
MPMCVLYTNLKDSDIPPQLETRLAELIAKVLDRPMEYLNVVVLPGMRQFRLHNTDPACFLQITCIDAFDKDRNPTYTPPILDFLKTNLKLQAERIVIQYLPAEPHMFGLAS